MLVSWTHLAAIVGSDGRFWHAGGGIPRAQPQILIHGEGYDYEQLCQMLEMNLKRYSIYNISNSFHA
jgi:hypothetical protein